MPEPTEVLVVGELNVDVIVSGADAVPTFGQHEQIVDECRVTLGSSSAIFACGVRRLGHPTTMVGVVGADMFGEVVRDALGERDVDTSAVVVDPGTPTGVTVILNTGTDRALLTAPGSIGTTRRAHVPAPLPDTARHLHVGSVFLQRDLRPDLPALFDDARAAGLSTSFDPNWDPAQRWTDLLPLLAHVDVVFVNEAEAEGLTGGLPAFRAAYALSERMRPGGTVVVKRGEHGALAVRDGGDTSVPAYEVDVVDTTGAGDSFDAGFVHGMLSGAELGECLALGAGCGSLSTRAAGGTDAQPDAGELAELLGEGGYGADR
ncbi:carbohydrate kinase family protein [Actinopolymorpha rutila]|uniref:Sugar/nucleoside kinase (Ribokinase family) n=1 Tax=Actinopolymorpha rutila TaxID=446787 RepID=A0A852ZGH7_9ACTN|nr:carbohydrate kinase family protein [Actinopolymorpha rutila]NYH92024.1 sugar/nucleoside kinase (ribokinase family) [Actinopolymorpha rutila]